MPRYAPKPKSNFKPLDEGTYAARIYSIIDLGTHSESYKGGEPSDKQKFRITWELPTEIKTWEKDGKEYEAPHVIGAEYSFSMGKKSNLRKHIELMTTTLTDEEAYSFDIYSLIGLECMVSVGHKESKEGNVYAFINTVSRIPKGLTVALAINPPVIFDTQDWNEEVFQKLPQFIQDKINASMERNGQENKEKFKQAQAAYDMEDEDADVPPYEDKDAE